MGWLRRPGFVLVILLSVAFARALLYGFVLIPPWQAPDESGHYEYAREVAEHGLRRSSLSERETIQNEIIDSLVEERFWEFLGRTMPDPMPRIFLQDSYLSSQREDEPPLYYLLPAALMRLGATITAQLHLIRGWSIALYLAAIAFIYLGLRELSPQDLFIPTVGGALAALAPMPAFIGSSCNNDAAAMAISAAVLWILLRNMRGGWSTGRLFELLCILVIASLTKKTATFLWPLAGIVIVAGNWTRVRVWASRNRSKLPALTLLVVSAATVAWTWHSDGASNWVRPDNFQIASRVSYPVLTGSHALCLAPPAGAEPERVLQELSYNTAVQFRGQDLELTAWVAGDENVGLGYLVIYDGQTSSRIMLRAGGEGWKQVQITHRVSADADRLGVVLANTGSGSLAFDDLSLRGIDGKDLLGNGGVEIAAHWTEGWLVRRLSITPGLLPHLLEPASYSADSLGRYLLYIALTFAGFWANFGWLTIPLAPGWYLLLLVCCIGAVVGLVRWWIRRRQRSGFAHAGMAVMILAFALISLQTFIPMIGSAWQPQGRYLFPGLLPAVALLAAGWRELVPARARPALGAFLIAGMIAFEQLCIWGYLAPQYMG